MKTLNKNIRREFNRSKGRFLSVTALLSLGIFVFIGLNVTGSNMRETAQKLYQESHLADAKITSSLPLDEQDQRFLEELSPIKKIEFGQTIDVVIKGTDEALRVANSPKELSTMNLVKGRLPENSREIVLSSQLQNHYQLNESITLEQPKKSSNLGLQASMYTIVGFVNSSEYLKRDNIGATRAGSGQLTGYAYVTAENFTEKKPIVARVIFKNSSGKAYSKVYEQMVSDQVDDLQKTLDTYHMEKVSKLQSEMSKHLIDSEKQLTEAKMQLDDAKKQLLNAQEQVATQVDQLKSVQDSLALAPLEKKQETLRNQQSKLLSQEKDLEKKKEELEEGKHTRDQLKHTIFRIQSRNDYNDGYNSYGEDTHRLDVLARIFPVFFFLIAVLVSFTTMRRMVEEKRIEMGSLRALGYSKREVMREFIIYSFAAAVIGTVIGSYFGLVFLPINIFKTYQSNFTFEKIVLAPHYGVVLLGFFIAFCSTVLASFTAARKELKTIPAQLMLPKPPAKGSRIFLERITPIWKRMTFSQKVTARNLFRYKGRMIMTIIGVAGATALMITGFGIKDSLYTIADRQFGKISKFDLIVSYNSEDTPKNVETVEKSITKSEEVRAYTPAFFSAITTKIPNDPVREKVVLIIPEDTKKLEDYVQLRDKKTGKKMIVNDEGVIVSEKLAKVQQVIVGDSMTFRDITGKDYQVKVAGITTMYAGHYMYMNRSYYETVMKKEVQNNAYLIKLNENSIKNVQRFAAEFNKNEAAYDVVQAQESKLMIMNILKNMDNLILVMVISASLLSMIVLYTLTNVNVGERERELSTLKVLGFYPKEVLFYIYRETNLLTGIGILFGIGVGYFLHAYIMEVMPPANAMVAPGLMLTNIGLSIILTTLFSCMVMYLMNRKIQKVDMLEALKSVD